MKKDKFLKVFFLTTITFSYISIAYLLIKQFYDKDCLAKSSYILLSLTIINILSILAYTYSRYNINKFLYINRTSMFRDMKQAAQYSQYIEELKIIRAKDSSNIGKNLQDTVHLFPRVRFRKISDENVSEEDMIYKRMLCLFIFLFLILFIIGLAGYIYGHHTYLLKEFNKEIAILWVIGMISIIMLISATYIYITLLMFEKDEKLWINTTGRLPITSESSQPLLPSPIQSELDPLLVSIDDIIPKPFTASRLSPLPSSSGVFTSLSLPSSPVSTPPELNVFFASADDAIQKSPSTSRVWTPLSSFSTSSSPTLTPRSVSPVCSSDEDYHENILLSVLPVCSSDEDVSLSTLRSSSSLSLGSCMHSLTKY